MTHGFLPPHPAPTAIAVIFKADIGMVLLYGVILAIPTILLAGLLFGKAMKRIPASAGANLFREVEPPPRPPSVWISVVTALTPVLLMGLGVLAKLFLEEGTFLFQFFRFLGDPIIALLLAVLIGMYTLGLRTGRSMEDVMVSLTESVKSIAMILLIIGAGGAFKQVVVDSGTGEYIAETMKGTNLSPLLLAWLIAAALRISLGSATVAALTAAGIVAPIIQTVPVTPELLVLATRARRLTL